MNLSAWHTVISIMQLFKIQQLAIADVCDFSDSLPDLASGEIKAGQLAGSWLELF